MRLRALCIVSFLIAGLIARAQAATSPAACGSAENHRFDFWIGTWDVTQNGKPAGHSEVRSVAGGCGLFESWAGAGGVTGHSLNIYDAARSVWHQTWVDSSGSLLTLEGRYVNGAMVLESVGPAAADSADRQRITWTVLPSGEVRQFWQSSADKGVNWKTEFDGLYRRAAKQAARAGSEQK